MDSTCAHTYFPKQFKWHGVGWNTCRNQGKRARVLPKKPVSLSWFSRYVWCIVHVLDASCEDGEREYLQFWYLGIHNSRALSVSLFPFVSPPLLLSFSLIMTCRRIIYARTHPNTCCNIHMFISICIYICTYNMISNKKSTVRVAVLFKWAMFEYAHLLTY